MAPDDKEKGTELSVDVGVGAKASYEVSKKVTQDIPEDVTRANSAAWLDLISPITEWAGLKGDALRHKRELLRVQQDETLLRVGIEARKRLADLHSPKPVPTKTLIPLLENASLEEPDSPLIEWWANLLVSSADPSFESHPFFAELISRISSVEATLLEYMWTRFREQDSNLGSELLLMDWIGKILEEHVTDAISSSQSASGDAMWRKSLDDQFVKFGLSFIESMDVAGLVVRSLRFPGSNAAILLSSDQYNSSPRPLQVCRALEIIDDFEFTNAFKPIGLAGEVYSARVAGFSELGRAFMSATHRE